jgi:transposase
LSGQSGGYARPTFPPATGTRPKYPPELLDRGARVVIQSGRPIAHVARDLGVPAETLRRYVRQVEAYEGLRPDLPSSHEREEIKALRKEIYELWRANEIPKAASVFFATELDADRPK